MVLIIRVVSDVAGIKIHKRPPPHIGDTGNLDFFGLAQTPALAGSPTVSTSQTALASAPVPAFNRPVAPTHVHTSCTLCAYKLRPYIVHRADYCEDQTCICTISLNTLATDAEGGIHREVKATHAIPQPLLLGGKVGFGFHIDVVCRSVVLYFFWG